MSQVSPSHPDSSVTRESPTPPSPREESISSKLAKIHPWVWPVFVVVTVAAVSSWSTFVTAVYVAALAGIITAVMVRIGLEDVRHGVPLAGASAVVVALLMLVVLLGQIDRPLFG